jgi:hypothetical protein
MNLQQALVEIQNGKKIVRDRWLTDQEFISYSGKYIAANLGSEIIHWHYRSNNDIVYEYYSSNTGNSISIIKTFPTTWSPGAFGIVADDYSIIE